MYQIINFEDIQKLKIYFIFKQIKEMNTMNRICMSLFFLLISTAIYADEFWTNPKWGTKKEELEKNYKFTDVVIEQLPVNKKLYIDSTFADKFTIYLVDDNKYYTYVEKKFHIFAGFYNEKLQYVCLFTDEMENNKEVENEVLNVYPKIFNFDNSFLWSVKFNIVKEYCMIGSGIAGNEYFEVQIPRNRKYLQFTYYRFNHAFFKNVKIKDDYESKYPEEVFTRAKLREKSKR